MKQVLKALYRSEFVSFCLLSKYSFRLLKCMKAVLFFFVCSAGV